MVGGCKWTPQSLALRVLQHVALTLAPYRLQFYFNGHNWLASQLRAEGIDFELIDNAFVSIADIDRAQAIVDEFPVRALHTRMDDLARMLCPVVRHFYSGFYWSLMQVEYATDLVFDSIEALAPLYDHLVRTAAHAVKEDQIATFLGAVAPGISKERSATVFTRDFKARASDTIWPLDFDTTTRIVSEPGE